MSIHVNFCILQVQMGTYFFKILNGGGGGGGGTDLGWREARAPPWSPVVPRGPPPVIVTPLPMRASSENIAPSNKVLLKQACRGQNLYIYCRESLACTVAITDVSSPLSIRDHATWTHDTHVGTRLVFVCVQRTQLAFIIFIFVIEYADTAKATLDWK